MAENARGLAESRTLVALDAIELPRPQQHLPDPSAFKKATFGAGLSRARYMGPRVPRVIEGLRSLGAIAAKPSREAA